MSAPLNALIDFVLLARVSQDRGQMLPRDKFLVLAAASACVEGDLEVAALCRQLVLERNPRHLLKDYPDVPTALRSPDFQPFLQQLSRFCSAERAEFLVEEVGVRPPGEPSNVFAWAKDMLTPSTSSGPQ